MKTKVKIPFIRQFWRKENVMATPGVACTYFLPSPKHCPLFVEIREQIQK